MVRVIRSATLQMRVSPEVKLASERVLRRIGLSMTEAMELFLRRMIVDQRIPFDVVSLDSATLARLLDAWKNERRSSKRDERDSRRAGSKRG